MLEAKRKGRFNGFAKTGIDAGMWADIRPYPRIFSFIMVIPGYPKGHAMDSTVV
jgi:hypothetical protein